VDDDGEYSEINPTDYDKNFKIWSSMYYLFNTMFD
jgi:hypothetical protein